MLNLLTLVSKLTLAMSTSLAVIRSIALETIVMTSSLCHTKGVLIELTKAATTNLWALKDEMESEKEKKALGPPHVHVWITLVEWML